MGLLSNANYNNNLFAVFVAFTFDTWLTKKQYQNFQDAP